MTSTAAAVWVPVGALVINLFVAWIAWSIRGLAKDELRRVTDDIYKRLAKHDSELGDLRGRVDAQPKAADLQVLHNRVSDVKDKVYEIAADLRGTHAEVSGLKRSMELLVRHHMREPGE